MFGVHHKLSALTEQHCSSRWYLSILLLSLFSLQTGRRQEVVFDQQQLAKVEQILGSKLFGNVA